MKLHCVRFNSICKRANKFYLSFRRQNKKKNEVENSIYNGVAFKIQSVSVVNDPVEDDFGEVWITEAPFLRTLFLSIHSLYLRACQVPPLNKSLHPMFWMARSRKQKSVH